MLSLVFVKDDVMIITKKKLRDCLEIEKKLYLPYNGKIRYVQNVLLKDSSVIYWNYVKTLRKSEYYFYNRKNNLFFALMNIIHTRRFNRLGMKLGIELGRGVFDEGLMLFHTRGIVINGDSKVGKNCILHGANVIGNKGNDLKAPVLGDNVRLGTGAKVLGDVYIADGVQIGAGAVVISSCYEKDALLVGIPAQIHQKRENR